MTEDRTPPTQADALPPDAFTVNFVRLAGLDKHKARECEAIVRQVLSAPPAQAAPQEKPE